MKPMMYHYVRPGAPGLPHFPYLARQHFEQQLDYLAEMYGIVARDSFERWTAGGASPSGVLLTFDDGFRDHVDHVLPALQARKLFGIFYVPAGPISNGEFLDVHKLHLAVGRLGGAEALDWVRRAYPELIPEIDKAQVGHYVGQPSDTPTKRIKRLFNWELTSDARRDALRGLFDYAFEGTPPDWRSFYLDDSDVRRLSRAGMGVGGHGFTHAILSHLQEDAQRREVEASRDLIKSLIGHLDWGYCYPHGIHEAFNETSQRLVEEAGHPFAFAVEDTDIETSIALSPRYSLPRHNCNAYAYGRASFGAPPNRP